MRKDASYASEKRSIRNIELRKVNTAVFLQMQTKCYWTSVHRAVLN